MRARAGGSEPSLQRVSVARYETTVPTMTRGTSVAPAVNVNADEMMIAESGSLRTAATIAAMPTAMPKEAGMPGRCAAAIPPAAPRNMAGNVGPPGMRRGRDSKRGLCTGRAAQGCRCTMHPRSGRTREGALAREQHLVDPFAGDLVEPIASAATTSPTAGMITNGCFGTNFAVRSPSRRTGMVKTAAARPITMVQPICANVGCENGASMQRDERVRTWC